MCVDRGCGGGGYIGDIILWSDNCLHLIIFYFAIKIKVCYSLTLKGVCHEHRSIIDRMEKHSSLFGFISK